VAETLAARRTVGIDAEVLPNCAQNFAVDLRRLDSTAQMPNLLGLASRAETFTGERSNSEPQRAQKLKFFGVVIKSAHDDEL